MLWPSDRLDGLASWAYRLHGQR